MKHIFTRSQVKQIILEELEADLLVENIERNLLQEGLLDTFKNYKNKLFPGKTDEEVKDKVRDIVSNSSALNSMPRKNRIGIFLLAGLLGSLSLQAGFDYKELSDAAASDAGNIKSAIAKSTEKAKNVTNFRQVAQTETEQGVANSEEEAKQAIERLRTNYRSDLKKAPISPGFGLFVDGDPKKGPMQGFAYVPASQMSDDEVMPFVGMKKADYELLLRATYLTSPGGDEKLKELVMGGQQGSSGYWAYTDKGLYETFSPDQPYGMLPPEWSVAYELLQIRAAMGKVSLDN